MVRGITFTLAQDVTSIPARGNCRVASRIACRERCTRRSGLGVGAVVSVTLAAYYET